VTRAIGVFAVSQCVHWSSGGIAGDCDTSKFSIHDISIFNVRGNVTRNSVASLKCSPAAPCTRIRFEDIDVKVNGTALQANKYSCTAVEEMIGWGCSEILPVSDR
jgi:galacturan 1,4-alpha-galacturonidase